MWKKKAILILALSITIGSFYTPTMELANLPGPIIAEIESYLNFRDAYVLANLVSKSVSKAVSASIEQTHFRELACPLCQKVYTAWCTLARTNTFEPTRFVPSGTPSAVSYADESHYTNIVLKYQFVCDH